MKLIITVLILTIVSCSFANRKISDKYILKVNKKYNQDIIRSPFIARGFFREKAACNGSYAMFTEGYGYLYSAGYNCSVPVDNFSFLCENMRKSDRKKCWLDQLKFMYKDVPEVEKQTDISPGYNSLFSGFRWFEKHGPLSKNNRNNYYYEIDESAGEKGLVGIMFNPLENASYSGILYCSKENFRIDHVVLNQFNFYSAPFWGYIEATAKIKYEYDKDTCYLKAIKVYYEKEELQHWIEFEVTTPPKSVKTNKNEYGILFRNDVNPMVEYNKSDWDKFNFPKDNDMYRIREDLNTSVSLEAQFKLNSNKKYLSRNLKTGKPDVVNYDFVQSRIKKMQKLFSD